MKLPPRVLIVLLSSLAVAVLAAVAVVSHRSTERLIEHGHRVAHSEQVIAAANALLITLLEAETGQRGYIITGEDRFLEPLRRSDREQEERIRTLAELTRDHPRQQRRIAELARVVRVRRAFQGQTVRLRASGRAAEAIRLVSSGRGKAMTDHLRAIHGEMVEEEQRFLAVRSAEARAAAEHARFMTVLIGAVGTVLLLAAAFEIWRDAGLRLRAERRLQAANESLVELNERMNRFVGIAAHDLRNPLGVVQGFATVLLKREELSANGRLLVEKIRASSAFMLRLVDDLLDVSRIEAGELRLNARPTDLAALVAANVDLNRELAASKRIAIEFDAGQPLPPMPIDPDQMEQVLNNLISNAVKFSAPGTTVRVEVERRGDHAAIRVRDRGPGIAASEIDRLFKPFGRASASPTAGEKSTGLGLAIAKNAVDAHGGSIRVESRVGEGTTFVVTLPVRGAAAPAQADARRAIA